jgi:hypothetical protein
MTPNTIIYILLFIIFLLIIFLIISVVLYSKKPCISVCKDCPDSPDCATCGTCTKNDDGSSSCICPKNDCSLCTPDCTKCPTNCDTCTKNGDSSFCNCPNNVSFIGLGRIEFDDSSIKESTISYIPNKNVNYGSSISNAKNIKFISKNNNNIDFLLISNSNNELYKINISCESNYSTSSIVTGSKFNSVLQRFDDTEQSRRKFIGIGTGLQQLYVFNLNDTLPNVIAKNATNIKYITKGYKNNIVYFIGEDNFIYILKTDDTYKLINNVKQFISIIQIDNTTFIGIGMDSNLYKFTYDYTKDVNLIWSTGKNITNGQISTASGVTYISKGTGNIVYFTNSSSKGFYALDTNDNTYKGPFVKESYFDSIIEI